MFVNDRFNPVLPFEHFLFTFTLGLALGVVVAGAVLFVWKRGYRLLGGALILLGVLAGGLTGIIAVDSGPAKVIQFQMKPYASELLEAGSLGLGGIVGALLAGLGVLAASRYLGRAWVAAVASVVGLGIVGSVAGVHAYTTRADGPHPGGTDTGHTVGATRVIPGLSIPTGLAVGGNGDIAIVELETAKFRLFVAGSGGYEQRIETRLPTAEGRLGLHAAFHPDYPAQPYVYVTAEVEEAGGRFMNVFRGRIQGSSVEFTAIIQGLPVARFEDNGDHFGSAIAFCRGSAFISVGDTEPAVAHRRRYGEEGVVRDQAQQVHSPIGKLLRYTLEGFELVPAGLTDSAYPVYALGFRNPFGMACDERTGFPVIAENGPDGHDQLRLAPPGSNHEWPLSLDRDTFSTPLLNSKRAHLAPTGTAHRTAGEDHELLLSAFQSQAVYVLPIAADGTKGRLRLLREVEGGAFAVATSGTGCVFFTDSESVWQLDDGRCQ